MDDPAAAAARLELHHNAASTCSQKVRLLLAEKSLPWYSHHLDLARFDQLSDAFLALNPSGMVPVLVHEGSVIHESVVISEYLEDRFDERPLRPPGAAARARMRAWTHRIATVATGAIKIPSFQSRLRQRALGFDRETLARIDARMPDRDAAARWLRIARDGFAPDEIRASLDRMADLLDRMEPALARDRWLAGDAISLADLDMAPFAHRLVEIGESAMIRDRPQVARWYAAIEARPSFRAAMQVATSGPIAPAPA